MHLCIKFYTYWTPLASANLYLFLFGRGFILLCREHLLLVSLEVAPYKYIYITLFITHRHQLFCHSIANNIDAKHTVKTSLTNGNREQTNFWLRIRIKTTSKQAIDKIHYTVIIVI